MALRILTTVNYSAGENAPGDSGLMFTTGLIASLVEYDPSLHFYVLVPNDHYHAWSALLPSKRVTPIPLPMAPRLHGGDFQFEPTAIYNAFDFKRFDIDVLFLNQLETVPAFLQFLNRHMFHNVPAVSYVHWFDTRRPSTPKQRLHFPALLAALAGMEASTAIGCNSAFGRDKVLLAAGRWFNQATLSSLAERMVVLPPGVSVREIIAQRSCRKRGRARAIVSHRLLKYTGVRHLLVATLPRLLRNRCDLEVLVTNPTRVRLPRGITELPRLRVATLSRADYIKALWESDIVIAPHRATHWSMSTIEAMCADCIPLMNSESFFTEMLAPLVDGLPWSVQKHISDRWFFFRGNLCKRMEGLLDNLKEEKAIATVIGERAREVYDWGSSCARWAELFHLADEQTPMISGRNPSMTRITEILRTEGQVTKAEILRRLRWAPKQRALAWTSIRKYLKTVAQDDPALPDVIYSAASARKRKPATV